MVQAHTAMVGGADVATELSCCTVLSCVLAFLFCVITCRQPRLPTSRSKRQLAWQCLGVRTLERQRRQDGWTSTPRASRGATAETTPKALLTMRGPRNECVSELDVSLSPPEKMFIDSGLCGGKWSHVCLPRLAPLSYERACCTLGPSICPRALRRPLAHQRPRSHRLDRPLSDVFFGAPVARSRCET